MKTLTPKTSPIEGSQALEPGAIDVSKPGMAEWLGLEGWRARPQNGGRFGFLVWTLVGFFAVDFVEISIFGGFCWNLWFLGLIDLFGGGFHGVLGLAWIPWGILLLCFGNRSGGFEPACYQVRGLQKPLAVGSSAGIFGVSKGCCLEGFKYLRASKKHSFGSPGCFSVYERNETTFGQRDPSCFQSRQLPRSGR